MLSFQSVVKQFGKVRAVDHLSFEIKKGEMISGTLDDIRKSTISGQKLTIRYLGEVKDELFRQSNHIKNSIQTANGDWEIYLSDGNSLNEVLRILIEAGSVESLRTSEVNLHEIFIESFKNGGSDDESFA